jgi:hypothetical protein
VVFPAPLMSTIEELGGFLAREQAAAGTPTSSPAPPTVPAARAPATETGSNSNRAPATRQD